MPSSVTLCAATRRPASCAAGNRGAHLGQRQRRAAAVAALVVIIGIQFDQPSTSGDLVADGSDDLVDAADFLSTLRHRDAGLIALGAIGTARDDGAGGDGQARPRHDALVDRLLEAGIGIARALGAEVALAGEPGHQRRARLHDRARRAQRQRLVQHLIVPRRLVVGMQEQVAVALDQPRHQGGAGQIDDAAPGRRGEVRPDGSDAVFVDQHLPAGVWLCVDAVEDLRRAQQHRRRRGGGGCDQQGGGERGPLHVAGDSLRAGRAADTVAAMNRLARRVAECLLLGTVATAAHAAPPPDLARQAAAVTITRDDWGIAHVSAATDAQVVFGAIYAQAEDDFGRIEANYLTALGRTAEAEGEGAIWQDLRQRLYVDQPELQRQYAASPLWLRKLMDAWADGLNFYLATHPAVHPKVLTRFEPWMALSFTEGSIGGDIERISLSGLQSFYGATPVAATADETGARPQEPRGSNGIAIAPQNTANGHALLLINPHTSFYFRSELQMTSGEGLNAYGASTWGQFFIYQGWNAQTGWMHTTSGVDNVDEFAETVVGDGARALLSLRQGAAPGHRHAGDHRLPHGGRQHWRRGPSPPIAPTTAPSSAPRAASGSRPR